MIFTSSATCDSSSSVPRYLGTWRIRLAMTRVKAIKCVHCCSLFFTARPKDFSGSPSEQQHNLILDSCIGSIVREGYSISPPRGPTEYKLFKRKRENQIGQIGHNRSHPESIFSPKRPPILVTITLFQNVRFRLKKSTLFRP